MPPKKKGKAKAAAKVVEEQNENAMEVEEVQEKIVEKAVNIVEHEVVIEKVVHADKKEDKKENKKENKRESKKENKKEDKEEKNVEKEKEKKDGDNSKKAKGALTVTSISQDPLTILASNTWMKEDKEIEFDSNLVTKLYNEEINNKTHDTTRIALLEFSHYLERYLLPFFSATSSLEHVISIIFLLNEKEREGISLWSAFKKDHVKFEIFFKSALSLVLPGQYARELTQSEKTTHLKFLIHAFASLEEDFVRTVVLSLVDLPLWLSLSPARLHIEMQKHSQLTTKWKITKAVKNVERLISEVVSAYGTRAISTETIHKIDAAKGVIKVDYKSVKIMNEAFEKVTKELNSLLIHATDGSGEPAKKKKKNEEELHFNIKDYYAYDCMFFPLLLDSFLTLLPSEGDKNKPNKQLLQYIERFLEFVVDLLSQLPTRRFFRPLLEDKLFVLKCHNSSLFSGSENKLVSQLLEMIDFYQSFEIDDHSGKELNYEDVEAKYYSRVNVLQRIAHKYFPEKLLNFSMSSVGSLRSADSFGSHFDSLTDQELLLLTSKLKIVDSDSTLSREMLIKVLVSSFEYRQSQLDNLNNQPLYPDEVLLWDENLVPFDTHYHGNNVLALPKLNLQFLTFHDYLLRSFKLFRLESSYEIREDILDVAKRLKPKAAGLDVTFEGWARMASTIKSFKITEVAKPLIGETKPARVVGEIMVDFKSFGGAIRAEWEQLREHDVLFLITFKPIEGVDDPEALKYGITCVRGCELVEMRDEENVALNDSNGAPDERKRGPAGHIRKLTVELDGAQYASDLAGLKTDAVYGSFNILMRRKAAENNFKAVLETIRDLMNVPHIDKAVPHWLHDVFLGYGDPSAVFYKNMPHLAHEYDYCDTFLDTDHIKSVFADKKVIFAPEKGTKHINSSGSRFRLSFSKDDKTVTVTPYFPISRGPYIENAPRRNSVRFTSVQLEAIRAGMSHGLTMVVGPPGTGKTDVAVQIINNLYNNFPNERTLIVTHSNSALNDLFTKIMERDIDGRHLVRLGGGSKDLDTTRDWSIWGSVNYSLSTRLYLLKDVERLATSLSISPDVAFSIERAQFFYLQHVVSKIEKFQISIKESKSKEPSIVSLHFPFQDYFADAPQPLFGSDTFEGNMEIALSCFRNIEHLFHQLDDFRAFEILVSNRQRSDYMLVKQAKIIAMTCTHAALARRRLIDLKFNYDNIIMEESAQILEVETFIPMVLQQIDEVEGCRLKRVILIGDHNQLPPVVKNMAFQKYGRLDQSLFSRFVRLNVPTIQLDMQGRARTEIADLYRWRYDNLKDLKSIENKEEERFQTANAGFAHTFQFIDVQDYNGNGETTPAAYFYQNLGEAEYIVAVFQYMRLLGYPAEKISILTTYNGQKNLIRDVIKARCAPYPIFGEPLTISTVDKYQGQQNDYILLSLTRTKAVGHLRDVRRLVVALSRCKLGLYIFGRLNIFENCYELQPSFKQLLSRSTKLELVSDESYPTSRKGFAAKKNINQVENAEHMGSVVNHLVESLRNSKK